MLQCEDCGGPWARLRGIPVYFAGRVLCDACWGQRMEEWCAMKNWGMEA